MTYYDNRSGIGSEENRGTVYHTGNGFYRPYIEPLDLREKRLIRGSGNGIGLASLSYIAISLLASVIYLVFAQILFPASNIHGSIYLTETVDWTFNLILYVVSLIIPFAIYALCIKMPLGVALPFKKTKPALTFGGILVCLGGGVVASYAVSFLQMSLEAVGIGITMPELETPETLPGIILYCITMTLAPAFIEEMIFRGIVMQSLRRFGDVFALVASALIFGIFHLNLIQMPYAFVLGLCIGYFVMRTGSLWVGVIMHFINNSVAVAFEFMLPYMSDEVYYMANLVYNLVCIILAVIGIVFLLTKYKDLFRFEKSPGVLSSGKKVRYFLTSPALIISMIAAAVMTLTYIELL